MERGEEHQEDKVSKKAKEGKGKYGQAKEGQGNKRTSKEGLNQAASTGGLAGNRLHV